MVNYNDIAKIAQVSPTTVSHVLNETRFVMPDTKKRVLSAMKKLKYQPNLIARSLATGKTSAIGLLLSDIKNPFFPEVIQGIEEVAIENDYGIFLSSTGFDVKKELKYISSLVRRKIDGIILASDQADELVLNELIENDVNFVFIDWGKRNMEVDSLYFDYESGITESLNYLISLEHKKIFFVSGPKKLKTADVVINDFINAVKKSNAKIKYKVIEGNYQIDGGYYGAKKILEGKEKPTAIICANDLTAIGVIKLLKAENIRIPEDISVIGSDNIELTEIISPSLTTIDFNRYEIGKTAIEFLLNRINNKKIPKQTKLFKTKLVIRESTSKASNS